MTNGRYEYRVVWSRQDGTSRTRSRFYQSGQDAVDFAEGIRNRRRHPGYYDGCSGTGTSMEYPYDPCRGCSECEEGAPLLAWVRIDRRAVEPWRKGTPVVGDHYYEEPDDVPGVDEADPEIAEAFRKLTEDRE
jgi:hypothetical protein